MMSRTSGSRASAVRRPEKKGPALRHWLALPQGEFPATREQALHALPPLGRTGSELPDRRVDPLLGRHRGQELGHAGEHATTGSAALDAPTFVGRVSGSHLRAIGGHPLWDKTGGRERRL